VPRCKQEPGFVAQLRQAVQPGTDASPDLASQGAQRQTSSACLIKGEGPAGQLTRDARRPSHDQSMDRPLGLANPPCKDPRFRTFCAKRASGTAGMRAVSARRAELGFAGR
jgi:hypothetical protein